MTTTTEIRVQLHADTAPMAASLRSVFDVLASSRSATDTFLEFFPGVLNELPSGDFDLSDDGLAQLCVGVIAIPALVRRDRRDLVTVEFNPSELFLQFVDAFVASERGAQTAFSHGWPILSVGGTSPTVAEPGEATGLPREGAA